MRRAVQAALAAAAGLALASCMGGANLGAAGTSSNDQTANAGSDDRLNGCGDPRVEISMTSFSIGLGGSWGDGVLICTDEDDGEIEYPFSVTSFDFASLAFSRTKAIGDVENLNSLDKFSGTYTSGTVAVAFGTGFGFVGMRNQHGVVIKLSTTQQGIQTTFGTQGIGITLK